MKWKKNSKIKTNVNECPTDAYWLPLNIKNWKGKQEPFKIK